LIQLLLVANWPDCSVTTVKTGPAFEAAVQRGDFDLILCDYTLPGYDGLTALAYARAHCPEKPFIYLSGTIGEERAIQAMKAGATDYVIKDRPARLIPAIEAAFEQLEQEAASQRAAEKIREQASLLDKSSEAICVTDAEGRVTYWNASAGRLYGWGADEVFGKELRQLLYAGDRERFEVAYALVLANGEWRGELRPTRRHGESVLIESSWSLVISDSGLARSILISDADITEKKNLETRLRQAQRLETLGMLAGGIAHDLNNVLAPILTSVEHLSEAAIDTKDREVLETVRTSARHGADLVRQLLAFAQGRSEQRDEVAVDALIGSVRRLLHSVMPPTIDVRVSLAGELWPVRADATQLRQVLLNLCLNARDAMPEGGLIEISAKVVQVESTTKSLQGEVKAGPHVRLSVADTGTGISPEVAEKIFTPFFTTKSAGKGTGLGLVNVAEIIKSHGGFLTLESQLGAGTTFHVHLPALLRATGGQTEAAEPRLPIHGRGEQILVIEDDERIRTVLEIMLSTRGYRVTLAADGFAGVAQLHEHPEDFALVLTDMNMPGLTGADVVRAVKAMRSAPKVIVLSGLARENYADCPELESVEFLTKPFTTQTLLGTVRHLLAG
jgi:PAS domain S-box-containing protein